MDMEINGYFKKSIILNTYFKLNYYFKLLFK